MSDNGHQQQAIQDYIEANPIPPTLIGQVRSEIIFEQTGKPWAEWFIILDDVYARRDGGAKAAPFISRVYEVSEWWAQTIVARYEMVIGLQF